MIEIQCPVRSVPERPTTAFILSLIGGIIVLLSGLVYPMGILWGLFIIIGAVMMNSRPEQHMLWGIMVLVFSILSLVDAEGGFFIGFISAFIGGLNGILWKP